MNKIITSILFCALSFILYSCSDDPASVGKDLLKQDYVNINIIDSFSDSLQQSSSYYKQPVKLGGSERNLIGKNKNVEASTLIRFFISFADSIKDAFNSGNLNIVSSTVEFYETYIYGDTLAPFDFTAHKINNGWTFNNFTADSLPLLSYDQTDVSSNKVFSDTLNTFKINNDLVKEWFQLFADSSKSDNYGIYLKPTAETQKVVGFQALSLISENLPTLSVIVEKPGAYLDTLSFLSASDVSVITGTLPDVEPENIAVQSGLAVNSKLKFDLSSIPEDVVISNAALTLNLDTLETLIGRGSVNTLSALFITDDSQNIVDSLNTISLSRQGNAYVGNIAYYVQRWLSGNNQGMIIRSTDEYGSVDLFSIIGSNAADLSLRPRLKITYLTRN